MPLPPRRRAAEADEADGWTVITHSRSKKKQTVRGGSADRSDGTPRRHGVIPQAATESIRAQAKPHTQDQFYRFQLREKRRMEMLQLQQRFENDKKKIKEMKEGRKFRPD